MPPDSFRLRYRKELTTAIKSMVNNRRPVTHKAARAVVPLAVPDTDRDRFVRMVRDELDTSTRGMPSASGFVRWRSVRGEMLPASTRVLKHEMSERKENRRMSLISF